MLPSLFHCLEPLVTKATYICYVRVCVRDVVPIYRLGTMLTTIIRAIGVMNYKVEPHFVFTATCSITLEALVGYGHVVVVAGLVVIYAGGRKWSCRGSASETASRLHLNSVFDIILSLRRVLAYRVVYVL